MDSKEGESGEVGGKEGVWTSGEGKSEEEKEQAQKMKETQRRGGAAMALHTSRSDAGLSRSILSA